MRLPASSTGVINLSMSLVRRLSGPEEASATGTGGRVSTLLVAPSAPAEVS
jgi:hypothetical protein